MTRRRRFYADSGSSLRVEESDELRHLLDGEKLMGRARGLFQMLPAPVNVDRGLAPETQQRIRELFFGRTCRRCGRPAERMCADQFFCADHLPGRCRRTIRLPRVYRLGV